MKRRLVLLATLLVSQGYARVQEIYPPLLDAAGHGDEGKVIELLESGVPVNTKNDNGVTALILASELGNTAVVRTLLKYDADPNIAIIGLPATCTEEESPDFQTVCASILPGGIPPFVKQEKWTALHFAVDSGKKDIALLLLKKGKALVDPRDARGRTPLMIAAKNGDHALVKLLLRHGAQINAKSESDRSALYYAVAYADKTGDGGIEVIKELKNNGAVIDDEIVRTAEKRGNPKIAAIIRTPPNNKTIKQVLSSE
jgi:ankyrin repeat protein